MTCIEKLKELHPEWDENEIDNCLVNGCPSDLMDIDDIIPCHPPLSCELCWGREYTEPVPHEFEYIRLDVTVYEGVNRIVKETKMHMTVLERIKQRYTGELVYRIRRQSDKGWIDENFYTEKEVREMLEAKIDG